MHESEANREARLRELASKLFFTLKGQGSQFVLCRDVDVPEVVQHHGLTLDEVEDVLIPTLTMIDRRLPNRGERWT